MRERRARTVEAAEERLTSQSHGEELAVAVLRVREIIGEAIAAGAPEAEETHAHP
jgi:hypothetical protein